MENLYLMIYFIYAMKRVFGVLVLFLGLNKKTKVCFLIQKLIINFRPDNDARFLKSLNTVLITESEILVKVL